MFFWVTCVTMVNTNALWQLKRVTGKKGNVARTNTSVQGTTESCNLPKNNHSAHFM